MGYREKINIYVPQEVGQQLESDARLFEILKKDKRSINRNRFLSMLLCGYYDDYCHEVQNAHDMVLSIVEQSLVGCTNAEEITSQIIERVILPPVPSRKGKQPLHWSLKPTRETDRIIMAIMAQPTEGFLSQYICRMLISYCRKSISQRERIIFKENYDKVMTACSRQRPIAFTTTWNESRVHNVIPYCLATGTEELFNYLLCEEVNPETGISEARTFRLNRICNVSFWNDARRMSAEVRQHCDRMKTLAPQYAINDDDEICVRLTDEGIRLFGRIYYGRPLYDRIDDRKDGHYMYFSCSSAQVLHYFRRFGHSSVEIIYPPKLREDMIRFHQEALLVYQTNS